MDRRLLLFSLFACFIILCTLKVYSGFHATVDEVAQTSLLCGLPVLEFEASEARQCA
jgi:hypothetical protein